jgi:hypothetical protein
MQIGKLIEADIKELQTRKAKETSSEIFFFGAWLVE